MILRPTVSSISLHLLLHLLLVSCAALSSHFTASAMSNIAALKHCPRPSFSPILSPSSADAQLKILVPNITTLRQFVDCSDPAHVHGFCIDVFERALSIVNPVAFNSSSMSIHYTCFDFPQIQNPPTYDDMVDYVANGATRRGRERERGRPAGGWRTWRRVQALHEGRRRAQALATRRFIFETYDAVVGDVTIGARRLSVMDFTHQYMESGVVILTKVASDDVSQWFFFSWPFSWRMWSTIIAAFFSVGLLICFIEHSDHPEFSHGGILQRIDSILWFMIEILVLLEKERIKNSVAQLLMVAWVLFVILLNASYTAGLSSYLTASSLSQSPQDLVSLKESGKPLGVRRGSIVKGYLMSRFHVPKDQLKDIRYTPDFLGDITKGPDNGGVFAIVDELPYVNMILSTLSSSACDFAISGQQLTSEGFGFGFNKKRGLATAFSIALLNLTESGCLQQIQDSYNMSKLNTCSTSNSVSTQVPWRSSLVLFAPFMGIVCLCAFVHYIKQNCRPRGSFRTEELHKVDDDSTNYLLRDSTRRRQVELQPLPF